MHNLILQRISTPSPRLLRTQSALAILQHHRRANTALSSVRSSVWSLLPDMMDNDDDDDRLQTTRTMTSTSYINPIRQHASSWAIAHDQYVSRGSQDQPLWWPTWSNDTTAQNHEFETLTHRSHHHQPVPPDIPQCNSAPTSPLSTRRSGSAVWKQSLLTAVKHDNMSVMSDLLLHGASSLPCDANGNTPLHVAVSGSAIEILVQNGADVNMMNKQGDTPLHSQARAGRLVCVSALLHAGANVNVLNNALKQPLHIAVECNNAEIVKTLLNAGANPNKRDNSGHTPLDLAYSAALPECLQILLSNSNTRIPRHIAKRSTSGTVAGTVRAAKHSSVDFDTAQR